MRLYFQFAMMKIREGCPADAAQILMKAVIQFLNPSYDLGNFTSEVNQIRKVAWNDAGVGVSAGCLEVVFNLYTCLLKLPSPPFLMTEEGDIFKLKLSGFRFLQGKRFNPRCGCGKTFVSSSR